MSTASAYPLAWPPMLARWTRTREPGAFKATLPRALDNVQASLRRFASDSGKKLDGIVISSNVTLGASSPIDPGVAVWFTWDGLQVCIAVDRYRRVEANLQAIHLILEARRVELRHGTLALVRATFTGFKALPPPAGKGWREVLGIPADEQPTAAALKTYYRSAASKTHPDRGGEADAAADVNLAYEQAKQALGII